MLFPEPLILLPLPTDGNGQVLLPCSWVGQPGPDDSIALQRWVLDPDGPAGVSATAGLRITES